MSEQSSHHVSTEHEPEAAGSSSRLFSINCDDAVHQLFHFLDGELTEARRSEIASHLDQCAPCGSAAHFEVELRAVIADRCRDRVPASLIDRVGNAINEEERHRDQH